MSEGSLRGFFRLLPPSVTAAIEGAARQDPGFYAHLSEIRLRVGRCASLVVGGVNYPLPVALSQEEISSLLVAFCRGSVYAYRDSLAEGYLDLGGGVRVGVAGRALLEGGRVTGISEVTSLAIRIPTSVHGAADEAYRAFLEAGGLGGLLVFSPPGVGKTTLLRDLCRQLSTGAGARRVALVDSRGELAAGDYGGGALVDILAGYPKAVAIEQAVRTLSPEVIIVDELGSRREVEAILGVAAAGVPLVASVHGARLAEILARPALRPLFAVHTFAVAIGLFRRDGRVISVREAIPPR